MFDAGSTRNPVPGRETGTAQASRAVAVVLLGDLDIGTAPQAQAQIERGLAAQPQR